MPTAINTLITKEELLYLGQKMNGQASPISPFFNLQAEDGTQRMPSAALVNADGSLRQEIAPVFQTLHSAQSFGLVAYTGNTASFEASIYYPPAGQLPPASLLVAESGLKLQSPPKVSGWVTSLGQYIGESLVSAVEVEMECTHQEAQVFLGAVDIARRKVMHAMADTGALETIAVQAAEVAQILREENAQWISAFFTAALELPALTDERVQANLQSLAQKGLVRFEGENLLLSDTAEQITMAFLTLNGHLRLHASTLDSAKNIQHAGIFGVQGQSGTALLWTVEENSVDIFSASPAQTMLLISSMLEAPANVFTDQPFSTPVKSQVQPQAKQTGSYTPPAAPQQYQMPAKPPKKKRKVWRWVLFIFIFLVMAACLLVVGNWVYWELL